MLHMDAEQVALPFCVLHAWPHAPQFPVSVVRLVSQPLAGLPSQSAHGATQLPMAQVPLEHAGTACGRLHAVLQLPQWFGSVLRLDSHPLIALPSQLPKPAEHEMEQVPAAQCGVPLALPHA
jgi:hypothetical protein